MNRLRTACATLAIFLAVLLPLEQSHCAWMGLQAKASGRSSDSGATSCCSKGAPAAPAPTECACLQLPGGSLPVASISTPALAPSAVVFAVAVERPSLTPAEAPSPALDVGSPPPTVDLGAHGLRAPPLSS